MAPPISMKNLDEYFLEELDKTKVASQRRQDELEDNILAPAQELHVRRQKLKCVGQILLLEQKRHAIKQKEFKERWAAATKTLQGVDSAISALNRSYLEQKASVIHALEMAARQTELQAEKVLLSKRLLKEKHCLTAVMSETAERVNKFKVVEKYLDGVVDASNGEFRSIRELVDRANLLLSTRKTLLDRNQRVQNEIVSGEKELLSFQQKNENVSILLNNLISDLSEDLTDAKTTCHQLESDLNRVKGTAAHRTMMIGQIKIATYNLYTMMCGTFRKAPNIPIGDTVRQLKYIKSSLQEVTSVRRSYNEMKIKAAEHRRKVMLRDEKQQRTFGRWQKVSRDTKNTDTLQSKLRRLWKLEGNKQDKKYAKVFIKLTSMEPKRNAVADLESIEAGSKSVKKEIKERSH